MNTPINKLRIMLAALSGLFILSCGSPFGEVAGTGQQGEAKIIGIAMTSNGTAASNQLLTVADEGFVVDQGSIRQRSSSAIDTVFTDDLGRFEIIVLPGQKVTISGRINNEFIYLPSVSSESGSTDLGSVTFARGTEITLYPWWKNDSINDKFTVKGTEFGYAIPDSAVSTIWVPSGTIELVHYDKAGTTTIPFAGSSGSSEGSIGDPEKWGHSKLDSVYIFPEMAVVMDPITLILPPVYSDGTYYAVINWGDNTPEVKTEPNKVVHKFVTTGTFTVVATLYPFVQKEPALKIEPIRRDTLTIKITENGKDSTGTTISNNTTDSIQKK